ncbi:MAG: glutathione-disulfide reductase [Alphaproteobacteria bacterium]|nr:MAG: glutathione-disulfide reductase [Alphaproteobacteria bacterium]
MSHNFDYDYFVIGAGSGGVRSARMAASHGAKVGIAEGRFLGGTCVNIGCVPKKLMAYAADYHSHFEDSVGFGWSAEKPTFDWKTLISNKDTEIERLNGIYKSLLENAGVTLHSDYASFIDTNTLKVGDETVTAEKILIATGGQPRRADFKGAEHMIVSDDAFYLSDLPKHVVIYGGGYIAVEFAHIFHGLGSKVTLVYRGDLFLRGFDDDIRAHLRDEMNKQGINLLFNTTIESIDKSDDLTVILSDGSTIQCDEAMAAIGRVAKTDNLNISAIDLHLAKNGTIVTNQTYQTSHDNIYAVGDVTGRVELTPVAIKEGHWLADTLFGGIDRPTPSYDDIPTAVFSRPNIGTVGLTEAQAIDKGIKIKTYTSNFKPMVHTLSNRDERTFMKMIVDTQTDKVIGIHIVGLDSPEMLQGFGVAIKAGATKAQFDEAIGIHPTSAEELVTMR